MKDQIFKSFVVVDKEHSVLDDSVVCVHKVQLDWIRVDLPTHPYVSVELEVSGGHRFAWYVFMKHDDVSAPSIPESYIEEISPPLSLLRHMKVNVRDSNGHDVSVFRVGFTLHHGDHAGTNERTEESLLRHSIILVEKDLAVADFVAKDFEGIKNVTSMRLLEATFARSITPDPYIILDLPTLNKSIPLFFDDHTHDAKTVYRPLKMAYDTTTQFTPPLNTLENGMRMRLLSSNGDVLSTPVGESKVVLLLDVAYLPRSEVVEYTPQSHVCDLIFVDNRNRSSGTDLDFTITLPTTYRNVSRLTLKYGSLSNDTLGAPYCFVYLEELRTKWCLPFDVTDDANGTMPVKIAPSVQTKSLNPPLSSLSKLRFILSPDSLSTAHPVCFVFEIAYDPRRDVFSPECKDAYA